MSKTIVRRRPMSEATKLKISNSCKGRKSPSYWTGKKYTQEHIDKIAATLSVKLRLNPKLINENNHGWKGDNAGYRPKHMWVTKRLGRPMYCWECNIDGTNPYNFHWANLSREYKRDLTDWARLCAKCHKNYDMGKLQLTLEYKVV